MRQIVHDYRLVADIRQTQGVPMGTSLSCKPLIFHILGDNSAPVEVLDIGFGVGGLGDLIKSEQSTRHWSVDGIDGWEANCHNAELFARGIYRNVWHGLAQEIPADRASRYKIICLLDVIEHLNAETAKWLLRTLLTSMGEGAYLFVSTPLWFMPQAHMQDGDLEEHLIGVPGSSMMALLPVAYAFTNPLVGAFVYGKRSLGYVECFQPVADRGFSYEMGMNVMRALNVEVRTNVVYKSGV